MSHRPATISEVRFAVGDGLTRAGIWRCWAPSGTPHSDVYLANEGPGHRIKVSIHESGRSHIAFDGRFLREHANQDHSPSRIVDQWTRSEQPPGLTVAFRVITPLAAVNIDVTAADGNVRWIPPPLDGRAIEVTLILTAPTVRTSTWPGARSMGTELVGHFDLTDRKRVWLVSHTVPLPSLPKLGAMNPHFFHGRTAADLKGARLRALVNIANEDGSRAWLEVPLEVGQ